MLENADAEKMRSTTLDGYRLFTTEVEYGGVKQRWVVAFSEKAFARETKNSIAERKLREALEKAGETIPDQKGKPTQKPTIRRVFQVFEGITVLYMGSERVKVLNMKPIHYKVLSLLGHEYEQMYRTGYG